MNPFYDDYNRWYVQVQQYIRAWQATAPPPPPSYVFTPNVPNVSYSQIAAKANYGNFDKPPRVASKQAKGYSIREHSFESIFPPLRRGPPPAVAKQDSPPLPRNLFDSCILTERIRSAPATQDLEFDSTPVKAFIDWAEGRTQCLSPYVASEIGLDQWLYDLRGKPFPTHEQEMQLKDRILELANKSPLKLYENIENKTLKSFLGSGFEWIECPSEW